LTAAWLISSEWALSSLSFLSVSSSLAAIQGSFSNHRFANHANQRNTSIPLPRPAPKSKTGAGPMIRI
jgi:hypothetical protein